MCVCVYAYVWLCVGVSVRVRLCVCMCMCILPYSLLISQVGLLWGCFLHSNIQPKRRFMSDGIIMEAEHETALSTPAAAACLFKMPSPDPCALPNQPLPQVTWFILPFYTSFLLKKRIIANPNTKRRRKNIYNWMPSHKAFGASRVMGRDQGESMQKISIRERGSLINKRGL